MSILEAIMLLSFGAAWPASIYKSYTSRSTKGKSVQFLIILLVGYAAGILNKFIYFPDDPVVYLYILNVAMVSTDVVLYFRNKRYEKKMASLDVVADSESSDIGEKCDNCKIN